MLVSIVLALTGALLFAVSAALQQRAARHRARSTGDGPGPVGLMRRLYADPLWRLGWLLNVAGFAVQALALHLGSLAVVQALFDARPAAGSRTLAACVLAAVLITGGVATLSRSPTLPERGS